MRKGKYLTETKFIMGIKLNEQRFKEVLDEVKSYREPGEWYEEESSLFNLHEAVTGLDGYWIGNIESPEGIVIGYNLASNFDLREEQNNQPPGLSKISLESLTKAIQDFESRCRNIFDYKQEIEHFCEQEDNIELHIFSELLWMDEKTIISYADIQLPAYNQYRQIIQDDAWDYRAD